MTRTSQKPPPPSPATPAQTPPLASRPVARRTRRRPALSRMQMLVAGLATIGPLVIVGAVGARIAGAISTEQMVDVALGAGENPGMLAFGAMFLASPVQWFTGRSQVRIRKYLGLIFFGLAVNNFAMFVVERGLGEVFSEPLLVAGSTALLLSLPLAATSSRRAQIRLGMRRWRVLHRLTYAIAALLLTHVLLIGDFGPGALLISLGAVARLPMARRRLTRSVRTGPESATGATVQPPGFAAR